MATHFSHTCLNTEVNRAKGSGPACIEPVLVLDWQLNPWPFRTPKTTHDERQIK